MKKSLLIFIMVIALCISFTACSNTADEDAESTSTETATSDTAESTESGTTSTTAQASDGSSTTAVSTTASSTTKTATVDQSTSKYNVGNTVQPESRDSGYTVFQDGSTVYVYFSVEYTNPNDGLAIGNAAIKVTVKDSYDNTLKNETFFVGAIAEGDKVKYSNYLSYNGSLPNSVQIQTMGATTSYTEQDDDVYPDQSDFKVKNAKDNSTKKALKFSCDVTNNSKTGYIPTINVILYNDGDMVGGFNTTAEETLAAGETKSYELSDEIAAGNIEYDDYEIVVTYGRD